MTTLYTQASRRRRGHHYIRASRTLLARKRWRQLVEQRLAGTRSAVSAPRYRRSAAFGGAFAAIEATLANVQYHVRVKFREDYREVVVHLIDGTYELFRHFYGLRRFNKGKDAPFGAVAGVLNTVLQMIEGGATHIGVATDHVIESFRNALWNGYKTGAGIEPALRAQFIPLEEALAAMGIAVWAMVELEADDALASAAHLASNDARVAQICIWTPDKDLAQCVREDRIVQVDRRSKVVRDAAGVRAKFGVAPDLIADYLALVGDAADGYPGVAGIGAKGAASLLNRYGPIEGFPEHVLGERRSQALLFKKLATLRTDAPLFAAVDELQWGGPTERFSACSEHLGSPKLSARAERAFTKESLQV